MAGTRATRHPYPQQRAFAARIPSLALAQLLVFAGACGDAADVVQSDGDSGSVGATSGTGGAGSGVGGAGVGGAGGTDPGAKVEWAVAVGTPESDELRAVDVDAAGNVYVTGSSGKLEQIGGEPWGVSDVYVGSFDPIGGLRWDHTFGDLGMDSGHSIVASGEALFVAGVLDAASSGQPAQDLDFLLESYTLDGQERWQHRFPSAAAVDLATDGASNVFVAGNITEQAALGGAVLVSAGGKDGAFASYTSEGAHRWSSAFGDAGEGASAADSGRAIAVSSLGNVFVSGQFSGSIDVGGGPLTGAGGPDILLASFAGDGTHRWSARRGSSAEDFAPAIAVDADENLFVAGKIGDGADLGAGPESSGGAFLASYTSDGQHRWSRVLGGSFVARALAISPSGEVLIAGGLVGQTQLDAFTLPYAGEEDAFFARFSATGEVLEAHAFGGVQGEEAKGIAEDLGGNVYVVGSFRGASTDLGGVTVTGHGNYDGFLLKFGP